MHTVGFVTNNTEIAATIRKRGEMKICGETMELPVKIMGPCGSNKGEFALSANRLKWLSTRIQRR
jgi:hypothetical protein